MTICTYSNILSKKIKLIKHTGVIGELILIYPVELVYWFTYQAKKQETMSSRPTVGTKPTG